ncbi:MAG: resolvase [Synechococcus sp.]
MVAAVDPGRSKCGLVLADCSRGEVQDALVVLAQETLTQLELWNQSTPLSALVIGNGTSSKAWQQHLRPLAPLHVVEEAGTTLRAQERYWQIWPARGWRRLLPKGLQLPPCELDGIAALVLLEDQLDQRLTWPHPPRQGPGLRTVPAR